MIKVAQDKIDGKEAKLLNTMTRYVTWKVRWILNHPDIYEAVWARHIALCRIANDNVHRNNHNYLTTLSNLCDCVEVVKKQIGSVAE